MEIQASRSRARVGADGKPVLLIDQDRAKWDMLLIGRGLTALERAEKIGVALGPYGMQAAIAACHARALRPEDTDWTRIATLYDGLARLTPSPFVELNRAVAVSMAYGPETGLEIVEGLAAEGELDEYPSPHATRGELLAKSGRWTEAREAFERASELSKNGPERDLLMDRAKSCAQAAPWWKVKDGYSHFVRKGLSLSGRRGRLPLRERTTMKCPKCSGLFNKVLFLDTQVERCNACNGLWFYPLELQDLIKQKGSERLDIGDKRDFAKTKDIETFRCPKDGASMIKMADVKQGHIWFESCGHCHGIFLDATEFKDLKEKSLLDLFKSVLATERKA